MNSATNVEFYGVEKLVQVFFWNKILKDIAVRL